MACQRERVRGSNSRALGMASISQICSLHFHTRSTSDCEREVNWQWHDAGKFMCVAEILMARGCIVWAMPPNPPRSSCLACEYLLHLALWHGHGFPVCERG
eukprot:6464481-Amphidinium_carterae.1